MKTKSAIGIDISSSKFVIAIINRGGVEVLTNQSSYRQTRTYSIWGDQRLTGLQAKPKIQKSLKNSIFHPQRLIGRKTQPELQKEQQFNFCPLSLSNNQIYARTRFQGQLQDLKAEQILGGVFTNAKSILELNHVPIRDVVFSVPS